MCHRRWLVLVLALMLAACNRSAPMPTTSLAPSATRTSVASPTTVIVIASASPGATPTHLAIGTPSVAPAIACTPTMGDELSPSYRAGAPVRASVGRGHVLSGIVRSGRDCAPIVGAQVELWPEAPGGGHPDAARATLFTDGSGVYQFECDPPDHIHMRVTAPGHRTFASNAYHPGGRARGTFDIVLAPDAP